MGKFKNNAAYKGDDKVLKASNEHIEIMKALTVLNNNPELMKGYSLNKINVFNSLENKGGFVNLDLALYNFNLLLTQVGKFKKVPNNFNDQKNGVKISNFAKVLYSEIMTSVSTIDNRALKAFAGTELGDLADLADNKQKLDWLLKLREELVSEYKKLTLADQTKIQDFNDPVEYLFYLVSQGITYYVGINGIFDYETPQYGLRTGDALH